MPPNQDDQLIDQLTKLSTLSHGELVHFFRQDLSSVPADKIIGHLRLALMFIPSAEQDVIKRAIFEVLPSSNQSRVLTQYLKTPAASDIIFDNPLAELSIEETSEIDQLPPMIARSDHAGGYDFENKLQAVWDVMPASIKEQLSNDPLRHERLRSIIITYLKGIRDRLETYQRLVIKQNMGGLELTHELADQIFMVLDGVPGAPAPAASPVTPQDVMSELARKLSLANEQKNKPADNTTAVNLQRIKKLTQEAPLANNSVPQPPAVVSPVVNSTKPRSAPSTNNASRFTDIRQPDAEESAPAELADRPAELAGRQDAEDVPEESAHLVGPVDVFSSLSINDLRHASSGAEFASKLLAQMNILGKDDYTRKFAAVKSWRNSPLHQLYLSIGGQCLGSGLNIDDYLAAHAGAQTLTADEFDAISTLNEKLRF